MSNKARILDDMARMAGGAVNIASGLSQQIKEEVKSRVDIMATRLDLIPREEYEQLEAMVKKLESRVTKLEKASKPSAKKTTTKKAKS